MSMCVCAKVYAERRKLTQVDQDDPKKMPDDGKN